MTQFAKRETSVAVQCGTGVNLVGISPALPLEPNGPELTMRRVSMKRLARLVKITLLRRRVGRLAASLVALRGFGLGSNPREMSRSRAWHSVVFWLKKAEKVWF